MSTKLVRYTGDHEKNFTKRFPFKGKPKEVYQVFIQDIINRFNKVYLDKLKDDCPKSDKTILPQIDKDHLLGLFKYHINNVGNPDGECQYGLATRGIELRLLQSVFNYLNMKPYGEKYKGKTDPNHSFGYFTLGHKEATVWAIKAAKTRYENADEKIPSEKKSKLRLITYNCEEMLNDILSAAVLFSVEVRDTIELNKKELKKYCDNNKKLQTKGKDNVIFILSIPLNTSKKKMEELKKTILLVRKTYADKCFVHLIASSLLDVSNFSTSFNILIKNSPRFYAYPPQPGTDYETSGSFYVDTVSISSAHNYTTSFSSGVLLTTTSTQKDFNDKIVSYIGAEDSTVVGSSNGHFCLLDYYFYTRFPFQLLHSMRDKKPKDLIEFMRGHILSSQKLKTYEYLEKYLTSINESSLGYPINQFWDDDELKKMFTLLIKEKILRNTENHIFTEGMDLSCSINRKTDKPHVNEFTDEIISFFKGVLFPHNDKNDYDGYVTTGGTEGNYVGILLAKQHLGKDAVLFLTDETHYSVKKGASIFGLDTQQVEVETAEKGNMDCVDLEFKIKEIKKIKKKLKVVVNVNLASTLKGSIDNLNNIKAVLEKTCENDEDYWIHCDGAMQGCLFPFLEKQIRTKVVPFTLKSTSSEHVSIDSIAISAHKFLGAPFPCGICLFRYKYSRKVINDLYKKLPNRVTDVIELKEYIEKFGTIISGSQNYYMSIIIWKRITQLGKKGLTVFAKKCIVVAEYAEHKLKKEASNTGVRPFRNKYCNVITLTPSPARKIMDKYNLPNTEGGDNIGHIVIMPHVTKGLIDKLVKDMKENPVPVGAEL